MLSKRSHTSVADQLANGEIDALQAMELTRAAALRTLDRTAKSRASLQASLLRRGFPEQAVEVILARFVAVGLIDDAAYASVVVRTCSHERGMARPAIMRELMRRGIPTEIAQQAVSEVDPDAEGVAIGQLVTRSLAQSSGLPKQTRVRRAVSCLQRKGYEANQAYAAVLAALGAELELDGDLDSYDAVS